MDKESIHNHIFESSKTRLRETFLQNNYPEYYVQFTEFINANIFLQDYPFKEKYYHFYHNITEMIGCKECGTKTTMSKSFLDGYKKYCGSSCFNKSDEGKLKIKESNLAKYGYTTASQSKEVKDKIKQTNIERYGVKSTLSLDYVKEKIKQTNIERYGDEHTFKSEIVKDKIKQSHLERYGKTSYTQTQEYLDKSKKTNLEKYGKEYHMQTDEYLDKTKKTNLEKYGNVWYLSSDKHKELITDEYIKDNQEKSKQTNLERYGVENYTKSQEHLNIANNKYLKLYNLVRISDTNSTYNFISNNCNHNFYINRTTFDMRIRRNINPCTICIPIDIHSSNQELNILEWLKSLNIEVVHSDRIMIKPFELDIYLPEYNIAIEFNGLYWHSDVFKDRNYHHNKTIACENVGIDLIHIWEDDWLYRQDIVKSIILNRLGLITNKIYGRKCNIIEITDKKTVRRFLDDNHIQGYANNTITLGLEYNGELVSAMLFGNSRKDEDGILLTRFVNKINCNVIGGANKLFNYFLKNYNKDNKNIVSFADRSIFTGKLYTTLGFNFIHRTELNYWWVKDDIRIHKFNFSKKKLIKLGYDKDKSETTIMKEIGYFKVYGCGLDKYIYETNSNII